MEIDTELVEEIANSLEVTCLRLSSEQVLLLLDGKDDLIGQLDEWGPEDTDLLGQLADLLSRQLLGESWPTFGEEASGRGVDGFHVRFLSAARAAGYAIVEDSRSLPDG